MSSFSFSLSFQHIPKALPCLSPHSLTISCHHKKQSLKPACTTTISTTTAPHSTAKLAVQVAGLLATVAEPAFAVTGVNDGEDLVWVLIQSGIAAFFYFLVVPPIIMNWLRTRWYKRNLLEMYFQFMFVFIFYPGVLLWAPFLNFRKFPRDPSMKYPWSTPENPSQIKGGFLKYPWAQPEDYE